MDDAYTPWATEHFIAGHPALDLANAVFDRRTPEDDNELLKSTQDVANWLRVAGLADDSQTRWIAKCSNDDFLQTVHAIREASFAVFDNVASGRNPAPGPLGFLMTRAASGLEIGVIELQGTRPLIADRKWRRPHAVLSFLAMLSVEAYFALPKDKIRSCPRCGWLFVDTSRGGKRRWCSMKTCGNREKVSRHRDQPSK